MSFDPSRAQYNCHRCDTDPCSCVYVHKPLNVLRLVCNEKGCESVFDTMGELANHHLDTHEKMLDINATLIAITNNGEGE